MAPYMSGMRDILKTRDGTDYQKLDEQNQDEDITQRSARLRRAANRRSQATTTRLLTILLVLSNACWFASSVFIMNHNRRSISGYEEQEQAQNIQVSDFNHDIKRTSAYSPILDKVHLEQRPVLFNGAVSDNTSIWRADPSPEVDQAWDDLSTEGFELITVTGSELLKAGKEPLVSVKTPPDWKLQEPSTSLGEGTTYIAQIDVFHQIHCLNELRKQIHYDYYYAPHYTAQNPEPAEHMIHIKHCMHMLLQNLMCHADVDIIAHKWVHYDLVEYQSRPRAEPLADFSVVKQCRNFDALMDWTKRNSVRDLKHVWKDTRVVPNDAVVFDGTGGYFAAGT